MRGNPFNMEFRLATRVPSLTEAWSMMIGLQACLQGCFPSPHLSVQMSKLHVFVERNMYPCACMPTRATMGKQLAKH
jgi:hypothetical protein